MFEIIALAGLAGAIIMAALAFILISKDKPFIVPYIGFFLCIAVFAGASFLHVRGFAIQFGDNSNDLGDSSSGSSTESSSSQTNPQEEKEPKQDAAEPMDQEKNGAGSLGNYYVEIKGADLTTDRNGNPAVVITYAWTNNSDETTSAMVSVIEKAFQDGVELETAIIGNGDVYDSGAVNKNVRPGATTDVQCAYSLTSNTSTIEFEVTEFLGSNDEIVAIDFDPKTL